MEYKLIATDMDGTLLNDEHFTSAGNIEAIKEIQKKRGEVRSGKRKTKFCNV